MDVSDGFVGDLAKMLERQRRLARVVDLAMLPLSAPRARRSRAIPALFEIAATGGDDYELLASVAPADARRLSRRRRATAGVAVTCVGEAVAGAAPPRFIGEGRRRDRVRARRLQPFLSGADGMTLTLSAPTLAEPLLAAAAVAREAGAMAPAALPRPRSFTVGFKGPQDYLTEVDGEVERLIAVASASRSFPTTASSARRATAAQARRRTRRSGSSIPSTAPRISRAACRIICVSIACVLGRAVEVGVIYDPMLDELFCAPARRRRAGSTATPMQASPTTALREATIEVGWNMRYGAGPVPRALRPHRRDRGRRRSRRLRRARPRLCRGRPTRRLCREPHQRLGLSRRQSPGRRGRRLCQRFPRRRGLAQRQSADRLRRRRQGRR